MVNRTVDRLAVATEVISRTQGLRTSHENTLVVLLSFDGACENSFCVRWLVKGCRSEKNDVEGRCLYERPTLRVNFLEMRVS